jgi:hypothetical protein
VQCFCEERQQYIIIGTGRSINQPPTANREAIPRIISLIELQGCLKPII